MARARTLTLALAAIGLIAAAAPASAADIEVKSRVKIRSISILDLITGGVRYQAKGVVRSPEKACEAGRQVRLIATSPRRRVDEDFTNRRGVWKVSWRRPDQGTFRVVAALSFPPGLKCRRDGSRRFEL
jgi:hypothetical protein